MEKKNRFPVTSWLALAILVAAIAALFTELGDALNQLMVQFGYCGQGDAVCSVLLYSYILFAAFVVAILADFTKMLVKAFSDNRKSRGFSVSYLGNRQGEKLPKVPESRFTFEREEKIFTLKARPQIPKTPNQGRWASIEVENNTKWNIEECYAKLLNLIDPITKKSIMKFNHRNFDWGRGMRRDGNKENYNQPVKHPIRITAGDNGVFDVATTAPNNDRATFTLWQSHESEWLPIGEYIVVVRIFGIWNKLPKKKDQLFVLRYKGGNDLSIEEKIV